MFQIDSLLKGMSDAQASDLHLVVGQPPKYRVDGEVSVVEDYGPISESELADQMFAITSSGQRETYERHMDFDFAYSISNEARFRCNYFYQRTGYAAVFRLIPTKIQTFSDLKLPAVLKHFTTLQNGLVLVTGPTGSGKSTTLAALIDDINRHQRKHIVTIEDPVEFVHQNNLSIITHREVGSHTLSFADALRGISRQDADVVLVGEMRDLETIALALSAASMGTLVFGTLHTNSAPKTIDRIIDVFPSDQQSQVRTMLAESLRGVVAQQLLRKKTGRGRVPVNEILIGSHAVSNIIREGKIEKIVSVLQSGKREGMQSMDDGLFELVRNDVIDRESASMIASDKKRFQTDEDEG